MAAVGNDDIMHMPVWKSYLYHLQQQAPHPKRIVCQKEPPNKPPYYGREFHGAVSREDADFLLTIGGEGSYLIRESQRAPGQYTLAIRFDGHTKNFKLYYDGKHYVGEKRFDTIQDLVADGLITFYLESKAADYIAALSNQSNYAESPYVLYNTQKRKQLSVPKRNKVNRTSTGGAVVPSTSGAAQLPQSAQGKEGQGKRSTSQEAGDPKTRGSQGSQSSQGSQESYTSQGAAGGYESGSDGEQGGSRSPGGGAAAAIADGRPNNNRASVPDGRSPALSRSENKENRERNSVAVDTHVEARTNVDANRLDRLDSRPMSEIAPQGSPRNDLRNENRPLSAAPAANIRSRVNLPVEGRLSQILESRKAQDAVTQQVVPPATGGSGGSNSSPEEVVDVRVTDNRVSHATNTDGPMLEEVGMFSTPPGSPPAHLMGSDKHHNFKVSSVTWCTDYLEVMGCEKPHNFKQHTFKGPHWCDFCANFLWGLIAQGVKCQDCGFNAHKKCSEKVPNDCMPDMKYVKRMFGVDLTTLVKAQNTLIPGVVEMCVKEIEARGGLESEGLYRMAGFHDDVEAIKMMFDREGELTDISVEKYEDINTITSVLKLYFRILPIPLVTFDCYYKVMDIVKQDTLLHEERVEMLRQILMQLPPAHYHTLKYLMGHLHRVTEKQQKNMMNGENLAIVFAPTLLRTPETDPLISLNAVKFERDLIEILISDHTRIFDT